MPSLAVNTKDITKDSNTLGSPYDYINLMKPRVMSLVVFTAFVGYYTAVPEVDNKINPILSSIGIFAIALGAGASGVLNQWYDKDIDILMDRTKNNIEYRVGSAGGGNQLRQPYLKNLLKKKYHEKFKITEHIHFYGMYIGNHPLLSKKDVKFITSVINNSI